MRIRTVLTTAAIAAATLVPAGAAAAVGPSYDTMDALDGTWACGGLTDVLPGPDGFTFLAQPDENATVPPNHCINVRSRGNTGVILVFPPDDRGPAEGISDDPKADDRPCPHDTTPHPDNTDGTWWQPTPDPFWVCHHKP